MAARFKAESPIAMLSVSKNNYPVRTPRQAVEALPAHPVMLSLRSY